MNFYYSDWPARNYTQAEYQEFLENPPLDLPWVFPGGMDIDPSLYGEENTHSRPWMPAIDKREFDLAKRLLELNHPMVGICRGHQIIAAAAGGSLYQDIEHDGVVIGWHHHGPVHVTGPNILQEIFGTRIIRANSMHHQAVKDVPPSWEVAAVAEDGIIEAIWHPDKPVVSVQWHPEVLGQLHQIIAYLQRYLK